MFQLRGGICRRIMKEKLFTATSSARGAPTDKDAARLVAAPPTDPGQYYNAVFEKAKGNIGTMKANEHEVAFWESKDWVPGISEGPLPP